MTITEEEEIASPKQKRQKRFLQKERNKKKWSKVVRQHMFDMFEITPKMIGTAANHGKLCSCHMCGNPRKFFNAKTLQEQKFDEQAKSYVENIS